MLNGHGDDIRRYKDIRINFSSNVYNHFDHSGLFAYLAERLPKVMNYPEPTPVSLEKELAETLGISPVEVMATNGATEAIYLIAQTFRGASSSIIGPTFSEYADACRMNGHTINDGKDDLIWLCNPNNPTGLTIPKEQLKDIIQESRTVFIIDASYAPFTLEPLISAKEAVGMSNVLMLHSMTKEFAIPGLRLGYVTGNATLLNRVKAHRMPWSVNQLAQDAGHYLLSHKKDYKMDVETLMAERERVAQKLSKIDGIEVFPSDTHILLCRIALPTGRIVAASALKDYLAKEHGILIRDASNFEGLDNTYFRIAIQTPEENDELVRAIEQYLSYNP